MRSIKISLHIDIQYLVDFIRLIVKDVFTQIDSRVVDQAVHIRMLLRYVCKKLFHLNITSGIQAIGEQAEGIRFLLQLIQCRTVDVTGNDGCTFLQTTMDNRFADARGGSGNYNFHCVQHSILLLFFLS
ncbi:hypothetical protein D3C75_992480 [compost metagenome]